MASKRILFHFVDNYSVWSRPTSGYRSHPIADHHIRKLCSLDFQLLLDTGVPAAMNGMKSMHTRKRPSVLQV